MSKLSKGLVDTPLEDVEFLQEQGAIVDTVNILRERGQSELADMLEAHLDIADEIESCKV